MKEIVPNRPQMQKYLAMGLTQIGIAEQYERDTGVRCSRSAIAMAMGRYGLPSNNPRARHRDLLPWVLPERHQMKREARMLRLVGRSRKGEQLSEKNRRQVSSWLAELLDAGAVVAYNPDSESGFFWVARGPQDDDIIRREVIR